MCNRMLAYGFRTRPDCKEVLNNRQGWAIYKKNLNYDEIRSYLITNPKENKFTLNTIMQYKLTNDGIKSNQLLVKHAEFAIRGSLSYTMSKNPRGKCIIVNNETEIAFRESEIFKDIFQQLYFDVNLLESYDICKLKDYLNNLSIDTTLRNNEALIFMMITQGHDKYVYGKSACEGSDINDMIEISNIINILSDSDYLKNIPIIFIFNCCLLSKNYKSLYPL